MSDWINPDINIYDPRFKEHSVVRTRRGWGVITLVRPDMEKWPYSVRQFATDATELYAAREMNLVEIEGADQWAKTATLRETEAKIIEMESELRQLETVRAVLVKDLYGGE